MPKGVAALPSPRALADIFNIMLPMAGCSGGTLGKSRTINGRIRRAKIVSIPPASATFISPKKSVITPTSPKASSTDPEADSTMLLDRLSIGDKSPSPGIQLI